MKHNKKITDAQYKAIEKAFIEANENEEPLLSILNMLTCGGDHLIEEDGEYKMSDDAIECHWGEGDAPTGQDAEDWACEVWYEVFKSGLKQMAWEVEDKSLNVGHNEVFHYLMNWYSEEDWKAGEFWTFEDHLTQLKNK